MTADREPLAYMLEATSLDRLRTIMTRLYDDRPLSGDQRRDLANAMFALLGGATPIYEENR